MAAFRRSVAVSVELRVRNIAVNSNCTACVWTILDFCSMCRYTEQRFVCASLNLVRVMSSICGFSAFHHCLKSVE